MLNYYDESHIKVEVHAEANAKALGVKSLLWGKGFLYIAEQYTII